MKHGSNLIIPLYSALSILYATMTRKEDGYFREEKGMYLFIREI